ncbi:flagellar basal body P-ring protein FlgI [Pseudomonas beijingensis]|uniref:flagellar basal body P-ring protein FlgI n=1 Tax=Pseudomonas beijingensis TaxID=2954101 RepID=UPI0034E525B3
MSAAFAAQAERLKDIASISGVRSNQLIGYGLVVGLNGTGDQTTPDPVHPADLQQHVVAVRHQGAGRFRQRAVEERRSSVDQCRPAGVRQAWPAGGYHCLVHR